MRDLAHAQTRAISYAKRGLVLEAGCGFEQPSRFPPHAQHLGQLARVPDDHQRTRQIPPLQRHEEQEPQRRHRTVDRRRANTVLVLIKLESADLLRRRGVRRAPEECGEASDLANVVLLRMGAHAPHEHVVLHALAKRRDW